MAAAVRPLYAASFASRCRIPVRMPLAASVLRNRSSLATPYGQQQQGEPKPKPTAMQLSALRQLEQKLIWLSSYMIHNANVIRPKRDGIKVGGHQASSSSMATIMTSLYFYVLQPQDRVAVKPHASPLFHAVQYLLGNQSEEQLQKFRSYGGVQSYPSRTKDKVDVDFSTGSVGLGAAITTFAAHIQDYLHMKGYELPMMEGGVRPGRMVALVGDAELDEGNVYEALMESVKLKSRNNWWVIDYNRQSLDKVIQDDNFRQIERMFRSNSWQVVTIKYGKQMSAAFEGPGGKALKKWVNSTSNEVYSALTFRGGAAFREKMMKDIGEDVGVAAQLQGMSDSELHAVMTNLGGHCMESLLEAFLSIEHSENVCFIAYTVKGHGLPLAGHRDNHGLFINDKQMSQLQAAHAVPVGEEWQPWAGLEQVERLKRFVSTTPFNSLPQGVTSRDLSHLAPVLPVPLLLPCKQEESTSTQNAFGNIMLELGKMERGSPGAPNLGDAILSTAPDVATSTNLTGFLNQRGVFSRTTFGDQAKALKLPSLNKWELSPQGQHIELGIAENNLFLLLAAAGLAAPLFGQRVLPIGTLYDPFIARGLDALNYGCYQDSRFMVVATPSGITLSPEGGAHQSINTPLICMGQPGLLTYEPAFADELQAVMAHGLWYMQQPRGSGGSVCLRLSTRVLQQPQRSMEGQLREDVLAGGYWHVPPQPQQTQVVLVFCGVVAPEVVAAQHQLQEEGVHAALLQVTSPDRLVNEWREMGDSSHASTLLQKVVPGMPLVTVLDAHPASLSWLGSVRGNPVRPLGVQSFGQSGDCIDLYNHYQIDQQAIAQTARMAVGSGSRQVA